MILLVRRIIQKYMYMQSTTESYNVYAKNSLHVGRNGSLTDHKIPRCCEATRMHYAEKSNEKSNGYFSYYYYSKK